MVSTSDVNGKGRPGGANVAPAPAAVEPISEKTVRKATKAEVERAGSGVVAGEVPVSGSVTEPGQDVVRRNDVEGTIGPVSPGPAPFISEGVAQDIEMHGFAVDPVTGRRLTRDDLPAGRPSRGE